MLLTLALAGCGSDSDYEPATPENGGSEPPSIADTTAPSASIGFPGETGLTGGSTVLITGTASDESRIVRVTANGIDATTEDNYANWRVRVPRYSGLVTVETTDEYSNIDSKAVALVIKPELFAPRGIALDASRNRALFVDYAPQKSAIVALDLTTNVRTIISDNAMPDSEILLTRPSDIAIDRLRDRAIVTDAGQRTLVAVDLTSGVRTLLTKLVDESRGRPLGITIDSTRDQALVTRAAGYIEAIDLETGELKDTYDPADIPLVPEIYRVDGILAGITIDPGRDRALMLENLTIIDTADGKWREQYVTAIDLDTGASTRLSGNLNPDADCYSPVGAPPCVGTAHDLSLDMQKNRALVTVTYADQQGVYAVDLDTGAHTTLSDNSLPEDIDAIEGESGITVDATSNRALIADSRLQAIFAIDLDTGVRTVLADNSLPDRLNAFAAPSGIALDKENSRLLVADRTLEAVVAVDKSTGRRSILSDNESEPAGFGVYDDPIAIVVDKVRNRALVMESNNTFAGPAIIAVDLVSGARKIFSGRNVPASDSRPLLYDPRAMVLDEAKNRLLVTDWVFDAVTAVDLDTGERSILSNNQIPDATTPLDRPYGITLDKDNNRALVVNNDTLAVIAVDLDTGARTIFSDNMTPDDASTFVDPRDITIDPANNRALVTDVDRPAVIGIDLDTGARTILSDATTPDDVNIVRGFSGIMMDEEQNRILVVDRFRPAIVAVEPETGERVIMSR